MNLKNYLCFLLLIVVFTSNVLYAQSNKNTVRIWEISDPYGLNPLTSYSASAKYMMDNIFCTLLDYDPQTIKLRPQLAVALPLVKELEEGEYAGGMSLTYEIHPKARWDDGKPVTAQDYIFTIKAMKNPKVYAGVLRQYYEFIDKIETDAENPKKFTIYSKEIYFLAETASGTLHVLPQHIYDEDGLMNKFSIQELNDLDNQEGLLDNEDILEFATRFNSKKFEQETVVGCGPYALEDWISNDKIILTRKKKWWGDRVKKQAALVAYPDKIEHVIIPDPNNAIIELKAGNLDVARSLSPVNYMELKEDSEFTKQYELHTPDQFAYYYIGFNTKDPRLADKRVRRAFAHLVSVDWIIDSMYYDLASPVSGPIHPSKDYCNKDLSKIVFSLDKAKELLKEAGWKDTDNDGVLDKIIDGEKQSFEFTFQYNQGNLVRKSIGLELQKVAKEVGIKIELQAFEWTIFLDNVKKREFDLLCLAWVQSPDLDDMRQIWHTESDTPDGSNRVGFGNAKSDKIIDKIRVTLDPEKRKELYLKIQEIIYEEQPYIFLFIPKGRIAISKRFEHAGTSALRPGYNVRSFKLRKK